MSKMFFSGFLSISRYILFDLLCLGSAEADSGWAGKLMVIWWQVVSGILRPKIIKIWSLVFKWQSKMPEMFFLGHSVQAAISQKHWDIGLRLLLIT